MYLTMMQMVGEKWVMNQVETNTMERFQPITQNIREFKGQKAHSYLGEFEQKRKVLGVADQEMVGCFHKITSPDEI